MPGLPTVGTVHDFFLPAQREKQADGTGRTPGRRFLLPFFLWPAVGDEQKAETTVLPIEDKRITGRRTREKVESGTFI